VLTPVALAHVTVLPTYLEDGQRSTLVFAAPNERPPHAVTRLTVTVPTGIALAAASPPEGWTLRIVGGSATWSGGRTAPREIGVFRLGATTEIAPTAVSLVAVQRYDDGGTVRWTIPFTILPASHPPKEHLWPALIAGAVGLVAIAGGLTFLRLRRRAPSDRAT
jgi:uncharacterized protein YcnI